MAKFRTLIVSAVVVAGMWAACLLVALRLFDTWETRGQFGDVFGAVNALFSGMAFAGILFTIFLQREELKLQRDELRLQREEMAKSRETMTLQAIAQQGQLAAAVAAIKVAALEAGLEAIKMDSEKFTPSFRDKHVEQIKSLAAKIDAIASELSQEAANKAMHATCETHARDG